MGTLFDQPPRGESLTGIMQGIHMNARRFGFPEEMSPADWHALCDLYRTALALQNADVHDEQLAGFGNILAEIASALTTIANADSDAAAAAYLHEQSKDGHDRDEVAQ